MHIEELPGRYLGFDETTAARLAHAAAVRDAVAILAYTGAVYFPAQFLIDEMQRQLLDRITSFAIHARRAMEIFDIREVQIEGSRWRFKEDIEGMNPETNLWKVIGRIIHARRLQVYVLQRSSEIMLPAGYEWVPTHLEVQSDQGPLIHVNPYGMAFSYLDGIEGHLQNAQKAS